MGQAVSMGALLKCSFGLAPSPLVVLPANRVVGMTPLANIMDNKPLVNIMPFGMCRSLANPMVAVATAAAMGTLVPMPCIPFTLIPWLPGSFKVFIGPMPALNNSSKCLCMWGGMISIQNPGQQKIQIP